MPIIIKHAIASGLVLALCITFFIESLSYPVSAARLPQILIIILAFLAVMMFVEAYRKQKRPDTTVKEEEKEQVNVKRVLIFGTMIALYIFFLEILGYFILTPLFTFATLMYLKATNVVVAILISICFTAIIYVLFSMFLNVPIPLGIFF